MGNIGRWKANNNDDDANTNTDTDTDTDTFPSAQQNNNKNNIDINRTTKVAPMKKEISVRMWERFAERNAVTGIIEGTLRSMNSAGAMVQIPSNDHAYRHREGLLTELPGVDNYSTATRTTLIGTVLPLTIVSNTDYS